MLTPAQLAWTVTQAVPGREYLITVTSVHDGDTLTGSRRLLSNLSQDHQPIRLAGINSPELTVMVDGKRVLSEQGEIATKALMSLVTANRQYTFAATRSRGAFGIPGDYLATPGQEPLLVLRTDPTAVDETEKYGRILGVLLPLSRWRRNLSDADFWSTSINQLMLDAGMANPDGMVPPW